jgi:hypothetical protein
MEQVADVVFRAADLWLDSTLTPQLNRAGRVKVAASRWLGPTTAGRLSRSTAETVRCAIASNPVCPQPLIVRFSGDRKLAVRRAALRHPRCPYDLVFRSEDGDVLCHPDCPPDRIVEALTRREDRHARADVLLHPNLPADVRRSLVGQLRPTELWALLENPSTTHPEALTIIEQQTGSSSGSVATWKWSEHPHADPSWLAAVCDTHFADNQGMIAHIASNRATPAASLARIAAEHAHYDMALANPSCPREALLAALERRPLRGNAFDNVHQQMLRIKIAVNPAANDAVLALLTTRDLPQTRLYDFLLAHATTAGQARTVLALADTWTSNLAELVATAADIAA